eukprot:Hpha_TRINITY_DN15122_c1_g12::TRINITY_DN15122_c1_g12_i1::g.129561::m.129561
MCSPQNIPATPVIAPFACDDIPPPLNLGELSKKIMPVLPPSSAPPATIFNFLRQPPSKVPIRHRDVMDSEGSPKDCMRIPSVTVTSKVQHRSRVGTCVSNAFTVESSLRDSLSPPLSGATAYSSSRIGDETRSMCSAHSDDEQAIPHNGPTLIAPVM